MNLLVVSPYLPYPSWGAGIRGYYLLKALAGKHRVSLLALVDSADIETERKMAFLQGLLHTVQLVSRAQSYSKRLEQLMCLVRGRSYVLATHHLGEMQNALDSLMTDEQYDVVLFEHALMAGYSLPKGVKVVIDQHNIEHELLQRSYEIEKLSLRKWYNRQESRLLKPVEVERCRMADAVLVTSERERLLLKKMLPHSAIEVVPNGVDIETFSGQQSEHEVPGRIIFTGSLEYFCNLNALLFFAEKCWPLIRAQVPGATWQIVGKNPLPAVRKLAELPGVSVIGTVPDMRPYLAEAQVAIAPLLIGSGTRLKILEALAMSKAVVSTSMGCEGLSVESGKHLLVADQPETFAQAVITLLRSQTKRIAYGTAGRVLVEAEYSWQWCGDRLLHALDKLKFEG